MDRYNRLYPFIQNICRNQLSLFLRWSRSSVSYMCVEFMFLGTEPGRLAQSVACLTEDSGEPGLISGLFRAR